MDYLNTLRKKQKNKNRSMQTMFSLLKTIVLRGHMTSTESNGEQFMRPLWSIRQKERYLLWLVSFYSLHCRD